MKKIIYIGLFTFLGILLQTLIHGFFENWYTNLLIDDFSKYSLGFSWRQWFIIHHVIATIFFFVGAALGFWQGTFWWRKIYEKK